MTKIFRTFCFTLATIALTACATANGPAYEPHAIGKGKSQLVVYSVGGKLATVSLNGNQYCTIPLNGHFVTDVPANEPIEVKAKIRGDFNSATYTVLPRAGKRHYVRIKQDYGVTAASVLIGVFGAAAPSFTISNGTEAEARATKEGC